MKDYAFLMLANGHFWPNKILSDKNSGHVKRKKMPAIQLLALPGNINCWQNANTFSLFWDSRQNKNVLDSKGDKIKLHWNGVQLFEN